MNDLKKLNARIMAYRCEKARCKVLFDEYADEESKILLGEKVAIYTELINECSSKIDRILLSEKSRG